MRYLGSVWSRVGRARCWLMVFCFATLMPTPGRLVGDTTPSMAQRPAYCFVRPVGLVCYQPAQRLPIESSLVSLGSTGGTTRPTPVRLYRTQVGPALGTRTGSSRSASQRPHSAIRAALHMWTYEPRSIANQEPLLATEGSTDRALIFRDGFESGNLSSWSAWRPNIAPTISEDGLPEDGGVTVGQLP